jgi:hypothetical protein
MAEVETGQIIGARAPLPPPGRQRLGDLAHVMVPWRGVPLLGFLLCARPTHASLTVSHPHVRAEHRSHNREHGLPESKFQKGIVPFHQPPWAPCTKHSFLLE